MFSSLLLTVFSCEVTSFSPMERERRSVGRGQHSPSCPTVTPCASATSSHLVGLRLLPLRRGAFSPPGAGPGCCKAPCLFT